jgi:hypothetical protein
MCVLTLIVQLILYVEEERKSILFSAENVKRDPR